MIWDFIQNQILGMKWLNGLVQNLLTLWGIDVTSRLGGSISFFIYDVIKIRFCCLFLFSSFLMFSPIFLQKKAKKLWGVLKVWGLELSALF